LPAHRSVPVPATSRSRSAHVHAVVTRQDRRPGSRPLRSSHAPRLAVLRTQFLPAVLSLSLHRPFGTHCRTMSSTRTPWQLLKSDCKPTFFTASCETFLPPSTSAFLIMALYKFYHCIVLYILWSRLGYKNMSEKSLRHTIPRQ